MFVLLSAAVSEESPYGAVEYSSTCIESEWQQPKKKKKRLRATFEHYGALNGTGTSLPGPVTYFAVVNYIRGGRFNPYHWSVIFLQLLHALKTDRRPISHVYFSGSFETTRLGDRDNEWTQTFGKPILKLLEERQVG